MIARSLIAALAVIAIPIAVQGQVSPGTSAGAVTKRYCEVTRPPGSRLGGVRRCRSREEKAQARAERRAAMDRIQSQKALNGGALVGNLCKSNPRGC